VVTSLLNEESQGPILVGYTEVDNDRMEPNGGMPPTGTRIGAFLIIDILLSPNKLPAFCRTRLA
jgi:hypothetical protein